jgi:hypothetical protein
MKKAGVVLWLTRVALVVLGINCILIFAIPADMTFDNALFLILYSVWLVCSILIASTWLMLRYRRFFTKWYGWGIVTGALFAGHLVNSGALQVKHPNLSFFFTMLTLFSIWWVGVATAIMLWYRDASLWLFGLLSILLTWSLFFSWRFRGNLMELYIASVGSPKQSSPFWIFNSLLF